MAHHAKKITKGNPFAALLDIIGAATLMLPIVTFLIFLYHLYHYPEASNWFHNFSTYGARTVRWLPLVEEYNAYINYGYNLSWLSNKYLVLMRQYYYPFSQIIDWFLIKCFGLLTSLPITAFLCLIAYAQGRVAFYQKQDQLKFEKISATAVHMSAQFRIIVYSLFGFFLFFPFGAELPDNITIPFFIGELWLSSPTILLIFSTPIAVIITYKIAANFSKEI